MNKGERETRETGDEAQGTTRRRKKRGGDFTFPPSFARKFRSRLGRLGTRQGLDASDINKQNTEIDYVGSLKSEM